MSVKWPSLKQNPCLAVLSMTKKFKEILIILGFQFIIAFTFALPTKPTDDEVCATSLRKFVMDSQLGGY